MGRGLKHIGKKKPYRSRVRENFLGGHSCPYCESGLEQIFESETNIQLSHNMSSKFFLKGRHE